MLILECCCHSDYDKLRQASHLKAPIIIFNLLFALLVISLVHHNRIRHRPRSYSLLFVCTLKQIARQPCRCLCLSLCPCRCRMKLVQGTWHSFSRRLILNNAAYSPTPPFSVPPIIFNITYIVCPVLY